MKELSLLVFHLDVADGWPPVAKESMYARQLGRGYRICVPPLFLRDVSVDDEIAVERDEGGEVTTWHHIWRSARSTVWIMAKDQSDIEDVLSQLKGLRCNVERFNEFSYYSIDVPEGCSTVELDACLAQLGDRADVAYPSFRHPDLEAE